MINGDKVKKIIEERKKIYLHDDAAIEKKWVELLAELGDDEDELYEYLLSVDDDTFSWLTEICEEICQKFPDDKVSDLCDIRIDKLKKEGKY